MRKPRVTWFLPSSSKDYDRQLPSVWIRSLQMIPYLQEKGIRCGVNSLFFTPDVAVFLRRYDKEEDLRLASKLKRKGVKIVMDIVVNYFDTQHLGCCTQDEYHYFMKFVEIADEIWCASPFLREVASRYHGNAHFISDSIDRRHFSRRKQYSDGSDGPLRLGWAGNRTRYPHLKMLREWVDGRNATLTVIADAPPDLGFSCDFRKWTYKSFPNDIVDCDLCVAPRVLDTGYELGHSIFKVGVFMAEGVPCLASPVPSYELVLGEGKGGGRLCRTPEDWQAGMEACLHNREMLAKWSCEAVQVIEPYLAENVSRQIAGRITTLCAMS